MVITRGFHYHTGFTGQASKQLYQLAQFAVRVMDLKGRDYHLSKGTHDGNHALSFGNINANRVHVSTSNTKSCNWNPSFSHCRFNLLSDTNSPASR